MPVLAAHIVVQHFIVAGWNFYHAYIVVRDNSCQSLPHIVSSYIVERGKHYMHIFLLIAGYAVLKLIHIYGSKFCSKFKQSYIQFVKFKYILVYVIMADFRSKRHDPIL